MRPRTKRKQPNHQVGGTDAREAILDAVITLARDTEITDIGLAEICREAGVTSGALYFHFANKNAAVEAAVNRAVLKKYSDVEDLAPDANLKTVLQAIIQSTSRRHRRDRKVAKAIQIMINSRPATYQTWLAGRAGVLARLENAIRTARLAAGRSSEPSAYLSRIVLNSIEDLAMDVFQWRNPGLTNFATRQEEWDERQLQFWAWAVLAPMEAEARGRVERARTPA